MEITLWTLLVPYEMENDKINYDKIYNHCEKGHSQLDTPKPFDTKYKNQMKWKNFKWEKEYAYLKNGIVCTL